MKKKASTAGFSRRREGQGSPGCGGKASQGFCHALSLSLELRTSGWKAN